MKRKENSKHKLFNLDEDVIRLIEQGASVNQMSQSQFIEFLTNSWDESSNPIKRLKKIRNDKKIFLKDIKEIESQENDIMDNLQKLEDWRKIKQEKRPEVINNIVRILQEGRTEDAEIVAKNQAVRLGIPAMTLILESLDKFKKGDNLR